MIVKLSNRYRVDIDRWNFTLIETYEVQKGKTAGTIKEKTVGYFNNMEQVLGRIVRDNIADVEQTLLFKEYLKKVNEAEAVIRNLITNVTKEKKLSRKELTGKKIGEV